MKKKKLRLNSVFKIIFICILRFIPYLKRPKTNLFALNACQIYALSISNPEKTNLRLSLILFGKVILIKFTGLCFKCVPNLCLDFHVLSP